MSACSRLLPFLLMLTLASCATLPGGVAVPEAEGERVINAFLAAANDRQCASALDADVTVRYNSLFNSAAVSGYLQLQEPDLMKFVGETPFGQPFIIFICDGKRFNYATLLEKRYYTGPVRSRPYEKYAPAGFEPERGSYWLTGRFWPGSHGIVSVRRQQDGEFYWLRLAGNGGNSHLLLFDPAGRRLQRHLLVDHKGKARLDVTYFWGESVPDGNGCPLPLALLARPGSGKGTIAMEFRSWAASPAFPASDFELNLPQHFEKIEVQ